MQSNLQYNSMFFCERSLTKIVAENFVSQVVDHAVNNIISGNTTPPKGSQRTSNETNSNDSFVIDIRENLVDFRITERLVRGYEIYLMSTLPAVDQKYDVATIITPDGAFQLNQEIQEFKCIIKRDEFISKFGYYLLDKSQHVTQAEGLIIHDELTLNELATLDKAALFNGGNTVVGYTINEEMYLRAINSIARLLSKRPAEYPPLPEAYSKQILNMAQSQIIFDVTASSRGAIQTFWLFEYILAIYFQYTSDDIEASSDFIWGNIQWLLISLVSLMLLNFILLRGGCVEKSYMIAKINLLRTIEESMIGFGNNWINYGTPFLPSDVLAYGFLPVLILGGVNGFLQKHNDVLNVRILPTFKIFISSLCLSLTVGVFCKLGLESFVLSTVFINKNITKPAIDKKYTHFMESIEVFFAFVMFIANITKYPFNSQKLKYAGLYASNIINSTSLAMLDNFSFLILIDLTYAEFFGVNISKQQTSIWGTYYTLQACVFLYVFFATFHATQNLPSFSIEKHSNCKISNLDKLVEYLQPTKITHHKNHISNLSNNHITQRSIELFNFVQRTKQNADSSNVSCYTMN